MKILLLLIYFYSYIIHPSWYIKGGNGLRFLLLNLFILLGWLLYLLLPKREKKELQSPQVELKFLIPFTFLAFLLHLFFFCLPIASGEDFHLHVGLPALMLSKIQHYLPIWLMRIFLIGIFVFIFYIYKNQGFLKRKKIQLAILVIVFAYLYFYLIINIGLTERFGQIKHIFRYSAIGKTLYFLGYLFFGINELVPGFIQFIFNVLMSIYLSKTLTLIHNSPIGGRIGLYVGLFFPTFFHTANQQGLESGTLFFFIITFFFFVKYLKTENPYNLYLSMSWLAIGLIYKNLLLAALITIWGFSLIEFLVKRRPLRFLTLIRYSLIPIIGGVTLILVSYGERPAGLMLSNLSQFNTLFLGFKQMYIALGPIIFTLVIFSLIWCIIRLNRYLFFFLFFFISYYLMITATEAVGYIRHAQPFYLSLAFLLSYFLSDLSIWLQERIKIYWIIHLVLIGIMIMQAVFLPNTLLFNLSNYKSDVVYYGILPYREAMEYIKDNIPKNTKIYAPMGCEPSHFYLAKYKLDGKIDWIRKPLLPKPGITQETLYDYCKEKKIDYVFFPRGKYLLNFVDHNLVEEIFYNPKGFEIVKVFKFGKNEAFLAKVK